MTWREADWLTTDEVAAVLRKSRDYVARQCKAGNLTGKKLGNDWRIRPAAVDLFMGEAQPAPPTRIRPRRAVR